MPMLKYVFLKKFLICSRVFILFILLFIYFIIIIIF